MSRLLREIICYTFSHFAHDQLLINFANWLQQLCTGNNCPKTGDTKRSLDSSLRDTKEDQGSIFGLNWARFLIQPDLQ